MQLEAARKSQQKLSTADSGAQSLLDGDVAAKKLSTEYSGAQPLPSGAEREMRALKEKCAAEERALALLQRQLKESKQQQARNSPDLVLWYSSSDRKCHLLCPEPQL